jgi:hypothetical protein
MEQLRKWTRQIFGDAIAQGLFVQFGGIDVRSLADRLAYTEEGFRDSVRLWVNQLRIHVEPSQLHALMNDQSVTLEEARITRLLNGASHNALGRGLSGSHYPEYLVRSAGALEGDDGMVKVAEALPAEFEQAIPTPVRNQGNFPTCAAMSSSTAATYVVWRQNPDWGVVSAAWLWNIAKFIDVDNYNKGGNFQLTQATSGTELSSISEGHARFGWQTEDLFSYHPHNLYDRWDGFEFIASDAMKLTLVSNSPFVRISHPTKYSVNALKMALFEGKGVVVGVDWLNFWFSPSVTASGILPMPFPWEVRDGGHAVAVVGWKDITVVPGGGYFKIQNSWGIGWGQGGFGWLPYDYFQQGADLVEGSILFS